MTGREGVGLSLELVDFGEFSERVTDVDPVDGEGETSEHVGETPCLGLKQIRERETDTDEWVVRCPVRKAMDITHELGLGERLRRAAAIDGGVPVGLDEFFEGERYV